MAATGEETLRADCTARARTPGEKRHLGVCFVAADVAADAGAAEAAIPTRLAGGVVNHERLR